MNTKDIQQALEGFTTVEVISGPCVVRVHEALDCSYQREKSRYFISVDFKFRKSDALNIGKPGWLGCTKAEATKEAKVLAERIVSARTALNAAQDQAMNWDTFTNRHTVKIQQAAYDNITSRYCAEIL